MSSFKIPRRNVATTVIFCLCIIAFIGVVTGTAFSQSNHPDMATPASNGAGTTPDPHAQHRITQAEREAAADRAFFMGAEVDSFSNPTTSQEPTTAALDPLGIPDYFGTTPNYALSPLPEFAPNGPVTTSYITWALGPAYCDARRSKIASGDFNADGKSDVAILFDYGTSTSTLWILYSDGTSYSPQLAWSSGVGQWDWNRSQLTAGDYDGDGKSDLAIFYRYDNAMSGLWYMKSDGTNVTPSLAWSSHPGEWEANRSKITSGDFDDDGMDDVGVFYNYDGARSGLWYLKSDGTSATPGLAWLSGVGQWDWNRSKISAGDFDDDGKADVGVFYNYDNAMSGLWFLKSDGTTATPGLAWSCAPGQWEWNRSKITAGDFDGDGKADMAVFYAYNGFQSGLWTMISNGTAATPNLAWLSNPGDWDWVRSQITSGDVNGDGKADMPLQYDYGNSRSNMFIFNSNGPTMTLVPGSGIRKFMDTLPGLGESAANDLGQYIPVAIPDTETYPDADYYEISLVRYTEQMHSDLPDTTQLQGYVQTNTSDPTVSTPHYLGPMIIAQRDRPVRIKFTNELPTGSGGDLFLPVDTSVMGAGDYEIDDPEDPGEFLSGTFTQNRAAIHLHGGLTPWISDGTPHQWITPEGESTNYPEGMSVVDVPDMWFDPTTHEPVAEGTPGATNDPGPGSATLYYSNQQSSRLMWYHDHAYGLTRLNAYAGEAAGYLLQDDVEAELVDDDIIPADQIPLIVQDKTFVPDDTQLEAQDPTWDKPNWGGEGNLWLPHVYMPAQNPADPGGTSAMGRWHYGPMFHPPTLGIANPPIPNPLFDCGSGGECTRPWEPALMPATPNPSVAPEAFMDTPVVNGTAFPTVTVDPKTYRFRILNASNDRFWNLQLYKADPAVTTLDGRRNTEVKMVPAVPTFGFPETWPVDDRVGGVPDPRTAGPEMIQIGTEGGFLPAPVVIPNQPVDWNIDPTTFNFGNVTSHALLLGTAERADVIIDFSQYAGQTLILYNDAPAAFPARDPRYDYFTGAPNLTDTGGSPTPLAGYGPNTRTVMQIKVADTTPAPAFDIDALIAAFATDGSELGAFAESQDPILVPQDTYNSAYDANYPSSNWVNIASTEMTFTPAGSVTPLTIPFEKKAIQDEQGEAFDSYGRMAANLGTQLPFTPGGTDFVLQGYIDKPTESIQVSATPMAPQAGDGTQLWRITQNGVDTHTIHFHLFNVQVINRVAWDNAVIMPDANELGWKETVRVNPLEDIIVAIRPVAPTLPFEVPGSMRPMDVTQPIGSSMGFRQIDPYSGQPITVTNQVVNFGWEYVWHCHLLGHEENDMMRPMRISVDPPAAPSTLTANETAPGTVTLDWVNNATTPAVTTFVIERSTTTDFTMDRATFSVAAPLVTFNDTTIIGAGTFYYRVRAENGTGYSNWSNMATLVT
ncbi:MAG: FG-GAP-like repeat-containing protein [Thermoleophilia bacterium]|nr:FG-GAP-like repeat-containing protein [Thermoleophilia bacterium]